MSLKCGECTFLRDDGEGGGTCRHPDVHMLQRLTYDTDCIRGYPDVWAARGAVKLCPLGGALIVQTIKVEGSASIVCQTRLHHERNLIIQNTGRGKVYIGSMEIQPGETINMSWSD